MQDLVDGSKKNCKFLKKMSTLCEMSYITKGSKVVPCEMDPKKKKCTNSEKLEECDLEKVCDASLSETEEDDDLNDDEADDEDLEEGLATKVESERDTKPRRRGFLRNSSRADGQ